MKSKIKNEMLQNCFFESEEDESLEHSNRGKFKNEKRSICLLQSKDPITTRRNGWKNVKVPDYSKAELLTAVAVLLQIMLVILSMNNNSSPMKSN